MSEQCRSCQAPVMWLENATTGKRAPIDAAVTFDGNVVVLGESLYRVIGGEELAAARDEGVPLYFNHFATCPQARSWKGRKAVKP